jgi:tyrosine-protein kinase Etk/Wzc
MTTQPSSQFQNPAPGQFFHRQQHEEIDLMKYFYMLVINWYWFALALFLSVGVAYFINKYSTRIYKVSATLLIEDETGNKSGMGSMFGGSDMISGFGMYPGWYNLQNQILIMKSQSLASRTLHALDFNVSYFNDEIFGPREKLSEVPFIVLPDYNKPQPLGISFFVTINSDGSVKIECSSSGEGISLYNYLTERSSPGPEDIKVDRTVKFGEVVEGNGYSFVILPRNEKTNAGGIANGTWLFTFNSYQSLISSWSAMLSLKSIDENASMISLEIPAACPEKAQLFINKHLEMYLQRTLDKKNQVATNTINFIDRQLISISDSLNTTGMTLEDFRRNNQVVDLSFQAQMLFQQTRDLDNQKAVLKVKDDYFRYLLDYLERNRNAGDLIAPSVMGIEDQLLNSLVIQLNQMSEKRIAISGSGKGENPYLATLDLQIRNAKAVLEEAAHNTQNNNLLTIKDVNNRLADFTAEVSKLPRTERELLGIERKFKLNDNIYTFLLQRRAEAQIAKASNTADNEIIDSAIIRESISPKTTRNYGIALGAGLMLPALVLILIGIFNIKISSEDDIKAITSLPIAGHIIHSVMDFQTVVLNDPQSQVAETFRNLRTRLQFFTKETESPVILITSSMPAEGKTFASVNLASAYSLIGKKTVLVGFDLRKPKIYSDFNITEDKGVSTYLIGRDSLDDIIQESGHPDLSLIAAGPIPPNPSELAASGKTKALFAELKKRFDYIIIDSAPLGAVSDTFSLAESADITVIMVRHRKTIKHILKNILADTKANGLTSISLLLNDINRDKGVYGYYGKYRYGYGYGYGYGYSNGRGGKNVL